MVVQGGNACVSSLYNGWSMVGRKRFLLVIVDDELDASYCPPRYVTGCSTECGVMLLGYRIIGAWGIGDICTYER